MASDALSGLQSAISLPPEHENYKSGEREHGGRCRETDDIRDQQTVLSGGRIVVITKEQKLVDGRTDLVGGSFDQAQTQIPRRKFDAVEIARDGACRRQKDNTGGVAKALFLSLS